MIARFPGSAIIRFERRLATPQHLLIRPLEDPSSGSGEARQTYANVVGDLTRITYASIQGARLKEVYRYYESVLQGDGFEPLYNCAGESCSPNSAGMDFNAALTPTDAEDAMRGKAKGQRFIVGKLARSDGDVYASVYCVRTNPLAGDDNERVYTNLVIVETRQHHDD